MEDYYEYLDSNGVTTLYKLIKDDTVALIDSYSVTINGITTNLDNHVNNADIHTPIATIEGMIDTAVGSLNYATPDYVDTKVADLVNSSPETLDTLKELSDALGNDSNFATTVANQIGSKASKDDVYTKEEADTLLESKANSVHSHVVSDITDFPTIPTKVSDLTNDSGYITSVSWEDVTSKPELSQVAISGSYSDLSDTPIIPTKTSQLINDSGFLTGSSGLITSVSWSDITNKPNFSTVATSGSYTDLSNTPTIPTKVSQLENDMGFGTGGDTSDCVHKTGDETIEGVKQFTSDIVRKYTAVDITTTPTSDMQSRINFTDKNDKIIAYIQYAQKTKGVNYIGLRVRDKNSTTCGVQLNTNKEFVPLGNNSYSLGSSSYKWLKIYSDDVVHTSGNETIAGNKTFSNQMYLGGGSTSYGVISAKDNNSILRLFGGTSPSTGANLDLYGEGVSDGGFSLRARTSDKIVGLDGKTDGTLKWNGKNVAIDENLVHTSGNETINGTKTFTQSVNIKNNNIDLTVTPANTLTSNFIFKDKNDQNVAFVQYAQRNVDPDILGLYINDKDKNLHGIQITTNNYLIPRGHNTYNLGSPNNKWANVYATTFIGNLQGNADTATSATSSIKATQDSAGQQINKTYIKELSVSGRTITYKRGDNTTGTITTQDTNTTYSKLSQFTNDTGFITSSGSCKYATTAGSANSVAWANVTGKPSIPTTTPNAYVTASWRSGSNWYRKWSNGFIEQGGVAKGSNLANVGGFITLPAPFSNANYVAMLTPSNIGDGILWLGNPPARHRTSTATTLRWGVYDGITGEVCWYACGY